METTIAVRENTLQLLVQLKKKMNASSLDETIVKMAQKVENVPLSRFGSQRSLKPFKKSERARAHEL